MYRHTAQNRVSHNCKMMETADASFKKKSRPFLFLANATAVNRGWTPTLLAEQREVFDFGELAKVVIMVTTENFQHVLMLIEAWQEAGAAIILRFAKIPARPLVRMDADKSFAGIDLDKCYLPLSNHRFIASDVFKDAVRDTFRNDRFITVQG